MRRAAHAAPPTRIPLVVVAREWTRIGLTGFGGPPSHIALLRQLVVDRMGWMDAREFEDANAACSLLPGPASTQMSMFCALRVAGRPGVIVGGLGFVAPAVILIIVLSLLFLSNDPPHWIRGAGLGAGAATAAVAVHAARGLLAPSSERVGGDRAKTVRWSVYLLVGLVAAVLVGPYLVVALLACGLIELVWFRRPQHAGSLVPLLPASIPAGGLGALAWMALKVGALSFGGGFVIVPLMQGDAVHAHHWMTNDQFLNAVALGQVTPGPVVATVAAVGYAAHGLTGAVLAAIVAFTPSFLFIVFGGPRFNQIRTSTVARGFLDGAGPAAIGAILGAAILLAGALSEAWQFAILTAAGIALLIMKRGVVETLITAGALGVLASTVGLTFPA